MNIEHELQLVDEAADRFRQRAQIDPIMPLTDALLSVLTNDDNQLSEAGRTSLIYVAAQLVAREAKS